MLGDFDKNLDEGYVWNGHRAGLSFILQKSIFLHFVHHCKTFYYRYVNYDDRIYIFIMMGVVSNLNEAYKYL